MRKKQVLAVLLCVMMVLSLAACGKKEEKKPAGTPNQGQEENQGSGQEQKALQRYVEDLLLSVSGAEATEETE